MNKIHKDTKNKKMKNLDSMPQSINTSQRYKLDWSHYHIQEVFGNNSGAVLCYSYELEKWHTNMLNDIFVWLQDVDSRCALSVKNNLDIRGTLSNLDIVALAVMFVGDNENVVSGNLVHKPRGDKNGKSSVGTILCRDRQTNKILPVPDNWVGIGNFDSTYDAIQNSVWQFGKVLKENKRSVSSLLRQYEKQSSENKSEKRTRIEKFDYKKHVFPYAVSVATRPWNHGMVFFDFDSMHWHMYSFENGDTICQIKDDGGWRYEYMLSEQLNLKKNMDKIADANKLEFVSWVVMCGNGPRYNEHYQICEPGKNTAKQDYLWHLVALIWRDKNTGKILPISKKWIAVAPDKPHEDTMRFVEEVTQLCWRPEIVKKTMTGR